jgi:hypothetical protein
VAWCAKLKSRTNVGYYDESVGEDFMVKYLKSLIDVLAKVDYNMNKIINYVQMFGYNSSTFDINFLINILHNPPNHHIENVIGKLNYFVQETVSTTDGKCLKFLEAMNYAPPQTLDSFVKTFGARRIFKRGCLHTMDLLREIS